MSTTSSEATKYCPKCGVTKDVSKFYRQPRTSDGLFSVCARCWSDQVLERRRAKASEVRAWEREYHKRPEVREKDRIRVMKWSSENKHKKRAELQAGKAQKKGILVSPGRCQSCGCDKPLQKHHPDYTKPLDVIWLCAVCHAKVHADVHRKEIA